MEQDVNLKGAHHGADITSKYYWEHDFHSLRLFPDDRLNNANYVIREN